MPDITLKTGLIWHTPPSGAHYDWLLQNPYLQGVENAPVTTFRVPAPPCLWLSGPSWPLTPLPPHRKIYLDFTGPVSKKRGFVVLAETGNFHVITWTDTLIKLQINWKLSGPMACTLSAGGPDLWTLTAHA
jgi:hypothetical protein